MPRLSTALSLVAVLAAFGCESEREREVGEGAHPLGWVDPGDGSFHGTFLREQGYPLAECATCHGRDFAGGDVSVSCSDGAGCHSSGVADCAGTCHGNASGPRPASGAHAAHEPECQACHPVPSDLKSPHVNGRVEVALSELATQGGFSAKWNADTRTCSDTYCHQGESPTWESSEMLACDGCHSQSPAHDRFSRLVDESSCPDCHGGSPDAGHLDGELAITVTACDTCHGTAASKGAPAPGLDGAEDTSSPSVGAHRRHLDSLMSGRIGKVMPCSRCHAVPETVLAPGHLDVSAPASVDVILGSYDPSSQTCVVNCHFDRDPGPTWTDDSGAARACDACHDFPPLQTRIGTPHPTADPELDACTECHAYSATTHVDGEVTFQ